MAKYKVRELKVDANNTTMVKEKMTTNIIKVTTSDNAAMAKAIMEWNAINHLPVVGNYGELAGLLTLAMFEKHTNTAQIPTLTVADVMSKQLITIPPEASIAKAKKLLINNAITCLPVCANNHLVGIITSKDLGE